MSLETDLPRAVVDKLKTCIHSEFGTVSSAGVPIDTPMLFWPTEGLHSFCVGTGLAYPAKAERARKNPKTGLLCEGTDSEPVIAIAGLAAVHDANLQKNMEYYLSETAFFRVGPEPWPSARNAVWYWTRMIVEITPTTIYWWDSPAAMDGAPHVWKAPAGTHYPKSDPAPEGSVSAAPKWPERPWHDQGRDALDRSEPGHLTICDADGFPLSFRARSIRLTPEGFELDMPAGLPWPKGGGKATLSFLGRATFVGDATGTGAKTFIRVERAIPVHPFVAVPAELWKPSPTNYEAMMGRLVHETKRRNQPIPTIPEEEPKPSPGLQIRIDHVMQGSHAFGFKDEIPQG
jgi:hypothetical protein